eukprot:351534-Chlamydomonas_euryale.AAC.3
MERSSAIAVASPLLVARPASRSASRAVTSPSRRFSRAFSADSCIAACLRSSSCAVSSRTRSRRSLASPRVVSRYPDDIAPPAAWQRGRASVRDKRAGGGAMREVPKGRERGVTQRPAARDAARAVQQLRRPNRRKRARGLFGSAAVVCGDRKCDAPADSSIARAV